MSFVSLVFSGLGGAASRLNGVGGSTAAPTQDTASNPPQTMIAALTLDVLVSEATEVTSTTSRYDIEDGADVTDNVVREHERLSIAGWITAAQVNAHGAGGRSK